METPTANFTHHFLIAMPNMADPHFTRTLTYVAEHNDQGALGIIVNRPIDMSLATLFERIEVPLEAEGFANQPVYFGGPVQTDRGFVLHRPLGDWHSTLKVSDEIGVSRVESLLGIQLIDPDRPEDLNPEQDRLMGYLQQSLRAQFLFIRNKDYLVQGGKVVIVDESTGRLMPGRRWSDGLHQAVEAKEGVKVEPESVTYATV